MAGLSKSRYVAGLQCRKLLWWRTHEPDAPELQPDAGLAAQFAAGDRVTEHARARFPGGVLVDQDALGLTASIDETARLIRDGAPAIFEAAFSADGVFVAVDVLERGSQGWRLVEVKSTLDVKDVHAPDIAIQAHVVRRAGIVLEDVELMQLNRECRHPDLSNLFVRESLAAAVAGLDPGIPAEIEAQRSCLDGGLPDVAVGPHCDAPYECPFKNRCWPVKPAHHVGELYKASPSLRAQLLAHGCETIDTIPAGIDLGPIRERQRSAVRNGAVVVAPGLRQALAVLRHPVAFLDFETVMPAIPAWPGCAPYEQVPVQFSVHVEHADGRIEHREFLADGPLDPRGDLVDALLAATRDATTVAAYYAPFERTCLRNLALAVPSHASELRALADALLDPLPIIRDHVGHPEFHGSFSLKSVLPALVPTMGYDDLDVADGGTAAALLEALLLDPSPSIAERERMREALLRYCGRDTEALVALRRVLQDLA